MLRGSPRLLAALLALAGIVLFATGGIRSQPAFAEGRTRPGVPIVTRMGYTPVDPGRLAVEQALGIDGPGNPETVRPLAVSGPITVTYHGFSAQAQASFQAAVDIWNTVIISTVPIRIDATFSALGADTLGAASPANWKIGFTGAPRADTWYPIALANALAGRDLDPVGADINATFNSAMTQWYFGTDGRVPASRWDFESVVLHEIGHGLGFYSDFDYSAGIGNLIDGPTAMDLNIVNGSGQVLWTSFSTGTALGRQLISGNIYHNGTRAVAANGGRNVKLYAPNPWETGSSISHLDQATFPLASGNALMTPALFNGDATHDPGPVAMGIFYDMGWQAPVAATPTATPTSSPTPTVIPTATATTTALRPNKVYVPALTKD